MAERPGIQVEVYGLTAPACPVRSRPCPEAVAWLPRQDSNLGQQIQSLLCYRYTTGQRFTGIVHSARTFTGERG